MRRIVEKAVREYNRYRAPEAVAEVLDVGEDHVTVKFTGTFCRTCGINDWVEDFKYVLIDMGLDAELSRVIEPEDPDAEYRIGVFVVKRPGKP